MLSATAGVAALLSGATAREAVMVYLIVGLVPACLAESGQPLLSGFFLPAAAMPREHGHHASPLLGATIEHDRYGASQFFVIEALQNSLDEKL